MIKYTPATRDEHGGMEQYVTFEMGDISTVWYDYRDREGLAFACMAPTLEDCRKERDVWVKQRKLISDM